MQQKRWRRRRCTTTKAVSGAAAAAAAAVAATVWITFCHFITMSFDVVAVLVRGGGAFTAVAT